MRLDGWYDLQTECEAPLPYKEEAREVVGGELNRQRRATYSKCNRGLGMKLATDEECLSD